MVVHDDTEEPMEIPINTMSKRKTFVIVHNHVKELHTEENSNILNEGEPIEKKCKLKEHTKMTKKRKRNNLTSSESDEKDRASEISECDLNELKSVYEKCKSVIRKIESKYGHLLGLEGTSDQANTPELQDECQCALNKKILFDDDGTELPVDLPLEKHICPTKLKHNPHREKQKNIQIEYQEDDIALSNDINELARQLKQPDVDITHRNKIIKKIKRLKQELSCEIKFNKKVLVENCKSSPEDLFVFKGSNLSTLPGYKY